MPNIVDAQQMFSTPAVQHPLHGSLDPWKRLTPGVCGQNFRGSMN